MIISLFNIQLFSLRLIRYHHHLCPNAVVQTRKLHYDVPKVGKRKLQLDCKQITTSNYIFVINIFHNSFYPHL